MTIDRSHFLFLVGAIAATTAAACKTTSEESGAGAGGGAAATTTTTGGDGGGGATTSGGGGGGGGGTGGGDCDDSVGTPAACASACEGFDSCTLLVPDLKPAIAVAVVDCLNALDQAICTQPEVDACIQSGLAAACSDATADDDCATLAPFCFATPEDPTWQSTCHALVDGLTEEARTTVVNCASEGGTCDPAYGGLFTCIQSLTYL
jgi:hypothetical protein